MACSPCTLDPLVRFWVSGLLLQWSPSVICLPRRLHCQISEPSHPTCLGTSSIFPSSRRHQQLTTVEPLSAPRFPKRSHCSKHWTREKTHLRGEYSWVHFDSGSIRTRRYLHYTLHRVSVTLVGDSSSLESTIWASTRSIIAYLDAETIYQRSMPN